MNELIEVTTVIAKGANAAIQQLQTFHKTSAGIVGRRRQVLPLLHAPLVDMRKQNWAAQIPDSLEETGVSVHLNRDLAVGGDISIAGALVLTHSNV